MLSADLKSIRALERAAFGAWPAEEVLDVDGWKLRFMRGVTRRANSTWTADAGGLVALSDRVDRVEAFYRERSQPVRFQLSPASDPGLDAELARRGYHIEAPVSVLTAGAPAFDGLVAAHRMRVERRAFEEWFALSAGGGRFAQVETTYRGLLDRLGTRGLFALAELEGAPAGVGLAVLDGELCGIFSMLTLNAARRRGVGRAVLVTLARAALEHNARQLYLQVERENVGARELYAKLGFTESYGYHYRTLALPG